MKEGARILAIDDSPFSKEDKEVLVVGIVARNDIIEGVLSFYVSVDGDDSTDILIKKIRSSRFYRQIKLIALNGVTLGGLNIVDIAKLNSELNLPVIAITRRKPNKKEMILAIKKSGKSVDKKIDLLNKINKNASYSKFLGLHIQYIGLEKTELAKIIEKAYNMLRLAHMIASGVVKGESKGRI